MIVEIYPYWGTGLKPGGSFTMKMSVSEFLTIRSRNAVSVTIPRLPADIAAEGWQAFECNSEDAKYLTCDAFYIREVEEELP